MSEIGSDFAEKLFEMGHLQSKFEDEFLTEEAGLNDWGRIGWDHYDNSLEIYEVPEDNRLTLEGVERILGCGFAKIYVNHRDGWETHYSKFSPRGWRRKRTKQGFEISYWPEGWGDPETGRCAGWLTSGYMTIVPDPLEGSGRNLADANNKKSPT